MIPTGISLATKGVLSPRGGHTETKYTGFIRSEEISKPIIKVDKFYFKDENIIESIGKIEVKSVEFIEKLKPMNKGK